MVNFQDIRMVRMKENQYSNGQTDGKKDYSLQLDQKFFRNGTLPDRSQSQNLQKSILNVE
jgi:hypothetical protein